MKVKLLKIFLSQIKNKDVRIDYIYKDDKWFYFNQKIDISLFYNNVVNSIFLFGEIYRLEE